MEDNRGIWYQAEYNSIAIMLICGLLVAICILRAFLAENFLLFWGIGFGCFVFMLLFYSVFVECDNEEMRITYGIGLIKRTIPIFGIANAGPVRNEKLSTLPFNPTGNNALEIELRSGKKYFIPADNCKQFAQALLVRAHRGA